MKITALFLAFYMLIGGLIPRSDFSQLLHLQDLVAHYDLHVAEAAATGEAFTLNDFLWNHFVQPDGHQHSPSNQEHENLPCHTCSTVVVMIASITVAVEPIQTLVVSTSSFNFDNALYLKGFLSTLLHPPSLLS